MMLSALFILFLSFMPTELPDFDALWDYSNPKQTEIVFREILKSTDEAEHPVYVAELQTQIARTLGLQQKFDEGHAILDSVQKKEIDNPTIKVRYLLERSRLYNSNNQLEEAIPMAQVAFQFSTRYGLDYYAIDAAHMIAYITRDFPEKKIAWEEKALELVLKTTDPKAKKWEGSLYNNLGWSYFSLKDYTKAIEYFEQSKTYENAHKNEDAVRVAIWSIGKCKRMLGLTDEALAIFIQLEKEIANRKLEADGYVFEEIGECLLALAKPNEAKSYFKKAHEILSKDIWLQKNETNRISRLEELSR